MGSPRAEIRPARPTDIDAVCTLLAEGLGRPPAVWRALFDHPWACRPGFPERGVVVADNGGIHGFCGAIIVRRSIAGSSIDVCNITSWYVREKYRHLGAAMLLLFTRNHDLHITNLTPAPNTAGTMRALGFSPADEYKFVLPPTVMGALFSPGKLLWAEQDFAPLLTDAHRQILDDHRAFRCRHCVIAGRDGYAYIVTKRRPKRGFPCTEVLYCSDPNLLAGTLERFKMSALGRDRTLALIVDPRFLTARRPTAAIRYNRATYFRSKVLAPGTVDALYSELVVLPI